jgi:hypothetical protein
MTLLSHSSSTHGFGNLAFWNRKGVVVDGGRFGHDPGFDWALVDFHGSWLLDSAFLAYLVGGVEDGLSFWDGLLWMRTLGLGLCGRIDDEAMNCIELWLYVKICFALMWFDLIWLWSLDVLHVTARSRICLKPCHSNMECNTQLRTSGIKSQLSLAQRKREYGFGLLAIIGLFIPLLSSQRCSSSAGLSCMHAREDES